MSAELWVVEHGGHRRKEEIVAVSQTRTGRGRWAAGGVAAVLVCLLCLACCIVRAAAPDADQLFQQALYAEEINGDLKTALARYEQIVGQPGVAETVAVQAWYRMALCNEKLGREDRVRALVARLQADYARDVAADRRLADFVARHRTSRAAAPGSAVSASAGARRDLREKLRSIVIPMLALDGNTVQQAVARLGVAAARHDPAGEGVEIVLNLMGLVEPGALPRVDMLLYDVTLADAIAGLGERLGLAHTVGPDHVLLFPKAGVARQFESRIYPLPGDSADLLRERSAGAAAPVLRREPGGRRILDFSKVLQKLGASFPDGSSASYDGALGILIVRNESGQLAVIDRILKRELDPDRPARAALKAKMARLVLLRFEAVNAHVTEALSYLADESRELDPSGVGIDIFYHAGAERGSQKELRFRYRRISLLDALEQLARIAKLHYRIDADSVSVAPLHVPLTALVTRMLPVRGGASAQLRRAFRLRPVRNNRETVRARDCTELFRRLGIHFPEGANAVYSPPPNEYLTVRNEPDYLDQLELLLQRWERTAPARERDGAELADQLKRRRMADWAVQDATVAEAVRAFRQSSRRAYSAEDATPAKEFGVMLICKDEILSTRRRVTFAVTNVSVFAAIETLCEEAGLDYEIQPDTVMLRPAETDE